MVAQSLKVLARIEINRVSGGIGREMVRELKQEDWRGNKPRVEKN